MYRQASSADQGTYCRLHFKLVNLLSHSLEKTPFEGFSVKLIDVYVPKKILDIVTILYSNGVIKWISKKQVSLNWI